MQMILVMWRILVVQMILILAVYVDGVCCVAGLLRYVSRPTPKSSVRPPGLHSRDAVGQLLTAGNCTDIMLMIYH
jgi:hypothetical protein